MSIRIIAHRGGRTRCPENTMLAFADALEKGADGIELDVHFSKDNELPIHHDYYLGTTENGEGLIGDKNSTYLKSLDCGSWFSKKFKGTKMTFLPQILDKFAGRISFEIELKSISEEFVKAVLVEVKKRNLFNAVEFTSPHLFVLKRIKELTLQSKTGMFVSPPENWMDEKLLDNLTLSNAKMGGISVLHLSSILINKKRVKLYHDEGFLVHASNCNTKRDIKLALYTQVDQISTDNVNLAMGEKRKYERNSTTK